jgi:uncharacterized protein YndB with AHSA1/START domain
MTKATPESSDSLVFDCEFDEPPEKVWRALSEPRLLEAWLTAEEPSQSRSAEGPPAGSRPQTADYEVLSAEPHRLLRYRWRDREGGADGSGGKEVHSVVTFELAPRPAGGTHLRLTHGEFRVISAVPTQTIACVRPITSARRWRTRTMSFAGSASWRRAA